MPLIKNCVTHNVAWPKRSNFRVRESSREHKSFDLKATDESKLNEIAQKTSDELLLDDPEMSVDNCLCC